MTKLIENADEPAKKKDDLRGLRYLVFGAIGAWVGLIFAKALLPVINIKNPQMAMALEGLTAAAASYVGITGVMSDVTPKNIWKHPVTKSAFALSFAAGSVYLGITSDENDKAYRAERAARIFVDPKTVVGTREVTIADEHCQYKQGQEVTFKRDGKTFYTTCPR